MRLWHIPIQLSSLVTFTGALWRSGSEQVKATVLPIARLKVPFHQKTTALHFKEQAVKDTFSSSYLTVVQCWRFWLAVLLEV